MNKKYSPIWTTPTETLKEMAKVCPSYSELLRQLGLSCRGSSNHNRLKQRLKQDQINLPLLSISEKGHNKISNNFLSKGQIPIPLEKVLVLNSDYPRSSLKKRLIRLGMLEYSCQVCGITEWLGNPISLRLDHVNGVFDDNRIGNLRFLCPNCDSQMDTFAGKNKKRKVCNKVSS